VVNFDPAQVREIRIEKPSEQVVVRAEGDRWQIVAPVNEPADGTVIDGLLSFVRALRKVRSLDGVRELRTVGLDAPAVKLRLGFAGGQGLVLLLGGPNPAHTGVYAGVEGAPLIFLAPSRLARELGKTPYLDELRDKTILPIEVSRVRRVELARYDTRVVIARIGERRWRVERPFHGPGDDGIIRDLLWKVGSSQAHSVIRQPEPAAVYGLDRPHARLTVVYESGLSRTLAVSQAPDDPNVLYAQVDGAPLVSVASSALLADLSLAPPLFSNRQLLVYDDREVERITIQYPKNMLVLHRVGDRWRITRPVEGDAAVSTVENILEVLPNLRYATVEPDPAGDLRRYGLDVPRLAVTVELTGGRRLPTLRVGREEKGSNFVMVGHGAPVYTVDSRLLRVIPDDPTDAKRYPLPEQLNRDLKKLGRSQS
jgi:hypothetical protein